MRSLDSAVGKHLMTSLPHVCNSAHNPDWDGGTEETASQPHKGVSDFSVTVILPCGWLRLSTKSRFLCPCSGALREGGLPGEESPPLSLIHI